VSASLCAAQLSLANAVFTIVVADENGYNAGVKAA
jgi:hypothetical protein